MSVNSVLLVGRLGADPEIRYTTSGKAVCNLRVATRRYRAASGEEDADWHRVTTWEKTAELCHRYLRKGRELAVEGRLQTRKYEDREGHVRYATEVVASRVSFVGGRPDGAPSDGGGGSAAGPELSDPGPPRPDPSDEIPF